MGRKQNSWVHSGHRARMRQRVRSKGFEGMDSHEVIEFLLFYAIPRQDVNELAHRLIDRFGNIRGIFSAEPSELQKVPGVGARTARWLGLVGETVSSCGQLSVADRPVLKNCMDAFRFAARAEQELISPCCVQLCLDAVGRLLYRRVICASLSWGEPATQREALNDVISTEAHCAILLLCTGNQKPEAQPYDIESAARYAATLSAAGYTLLDVILAGGGSLMSMRRGGFLPEAVETARTHALQEDYLREMPEGELRRQDYDMPDQ